MSFTSELNRYIEKADISNNQIINYTGIDRSTFYKILKGTRLPTPKQLYSIIDGLSVTTVERNELVSLYELETVGSDKLKERRFVESVFAALVNTDSKKNDLNLMINYSESTEIVSGAVSGIANVRDVIKTDIIREMIHNKQHIDIFVSLDLLRDLGVFQILELLNSDSSLRQTPIRHLVDISVDSMLLQDVDMGISNAYLDFLFNQNLTYEARFYYTKGNLSSQLGVIFPYYLITSDSVIAISRDGSRGIRLSDKNVVRSYADSFDELFVTSDNLVSRFDNKEEYVMLIGTRQDKMLYIFEKRPGLSFMATEDFINKYIPDELKEFVRSHVGCFLNYPHKEIISSDGMKHFTECDHIEEAGFRIEIDRRDIAPAYKVMKSRLHDTLEIIDSDKLALSDNWSVTVCENEYVIIVPYLSNDKIIYIPEKSVARAFTDYAKKLDELGVLIDDDRLPME